MCARIWRRKPNWQLVERIDHCMMTSELDEGYFPNKPSSWLLFNCDAQDDVVCDCQLQQQIHRAWQTSVSSCASSAIGRLSFRNSVFSRMLLTRRPSLLACLGISWLVIIGHLPVFSPSQPGPPSLYSSAPARLQTAPILDPTSQFDRQLLCTGKKAIESSINDRAQRLHGQVVCGSHRYGVSV